MPFRETLGSDNFVCLLCALVDLRACPWAEVERLQVHSSNMLIFVVGGRPKHVKQCAKVMDVLWGSGSQREPRTNSYMLSSYARAAGDLC